jgi:hypothetical protein
VSTGPRQVGLVGRGFWVGLGCCTLKKIEKGRSGPAGPARCRTGFRPIADIENRKVFFFNFQNFYKMQTYLNSNQFRILNDFYSQK